MKIIFNGIYNQTILTSLLGCGIDYLGLDFLSSSRNQIRPLRYDAGIIPDRPSIDLDEVGNNEPSLMGSFDNVLPQTIVTRVVDYRLNAIELCTAPSVALVDNLRSTIVSDLRPQLNIAARIDLAEYKDVESLEQYIGHLDWLTFRVNEVDESCQAFFQKLQIPFYVIFDESIAEYLSFFKSCPSFRGLQVDFSQYIDKDCVSEEQIMLQEKSLLSRFASLS